MLLHLILVHARQLLLMPHTLLQLRRVGCVPVRGPAPERPSRLRCVHRGPRLILTQRIVLLLLLLLLKLGRPLHDL